MISEKAAKLPPFYVMEVLERAKELESMGKDIIHLEIGEPDFPTAPHICEAASFALTKGETKYTHSQGLLELREAIARHYYVKFKLDPDPARILVTSGTSPALLLVFMSLIEHGDEVIMSDPYYACYPNFVRYLGGHPVFVRTKEENGFSMGFDTIARAITSRTKAILINSPCNPTGHVMSPENLRGISEIAGNIPVISDEIYQGLIYQGKDHSILEYTSNAFVLNGFSKLYAMTGWRLGYLIAPKEYIRTLRKIQQNFFICANSFVQHSGIAALTGPQDQVREMVATYDTRRKFIIKRLRDIGFGIKYEPCGAYYVLANAKKFSPDSLDLSRRILEEAGVAVTPGIDFGDGAKGYLRFSYANSIENIKEGMDRIEKYLHT
ncbi:MAG TPA: pyridoxal phosphate-dependent aminotransferase [Candidatus Methanoperedens sp.]|nr:pyridoxal phosphate-dependent aminotransferase [Candidatus Methanoperedens sp.]